MNVSNRSKFIAAAVMSGLFVTSVAQATNGYFTHGFSTKDKGLAGATVAHPQDSLIAATNPAGMAFVGERMDVGLAVFSPSDRSFTVTGDPNPGTFLNVPFPNPGTTFVSDNDFFVIPQFGYNWQVDNDSAVGITFVANGGMNTSYPASATQGGAGIFGAGDAGIDLEQGFLSVTFAKKSSGNDAVGVSLVMAGQRFAAKGLAGFAPFSVDGANMTSNTHSTSLGAGFKLGYQGEITKDLTVGISYQSKIAMSAFNEYQGLFAEGGSFDIPSTYTYGLAYDLGDAGTFVLDVQRINYTDVDSVSNPIANIFNCPTFNPLTPTPDPEACFGGANGAGFGWTDMTIMKLGYEIVAGGNTYRVGYSKGDMPIPESQTFFNLLAPAVMETHITLGMTMPIGKDQELSLAMMVAPSTSVKGAHPFDGGATQIELEMEQKEVQVGWAWKF